MIWGSCGDTLGCQSCKCNVYHHAAWQICTLFCWTLFNLPICQYSSAWHCHWIWTGRGRFFRKTSHIHYRRWCPGDAVIPAAMISTVWHGSLASYVKLWVAHAPGMLGTFPRHRGYGDSDMHHGTCVTHVPWYMPESLTSGFPWSLWQGNVPGIPSACATHNFTYLARGPLRLYRLPWGWISIICNVSLSPQRQQILPGSMVTKIWRHWASVGWRWQFASNCICPYNATAKACAARTDIVKSHKHLHIGNFRWLQYRVHVNSPKYMNSFAQVGSLAISLRFLQPPLYHYMNTTVIL